MGKKFSRRIWQDAVGTCRRIICWRETAARYFGAEMQRRDDLKKGIAIPGMRPNSLAECEQFS